MRRALVLGGYGLIGSACGRALARAGFEVTGLGRSATAATRCPGAARHWIVRDMPLISVDEWRAILHGFDVVVNAAGALQDGAGDDLSAIHVTAIDRLVAGADGLPLRIVQVSAAGVATDAATAFFRTKARGDAIISARARDWVILRPVLVLSPEAWGGTALLRAAAALPWVLPVVLPQAQVQTVHVEDVAAAVVLAATGGVASGTIADLTEPGTQSFPDLVARVRDWLGLPAPRICLAVPQAFVMLVAKGADLLGRLGWRSPLRSTAIKALSDGIRGDPCAWMQAGGAPCRPLAATLAALPATRQERLFARAYLALPLCIATLSLFWLVSGLIGLARPGAAGAVLTVGGMTPGTAMLIVAAGGVADIGLGLAILARRWCRTAAFGMIVLSAAYLAGSLIAAPSLWLDPLGPMVKVLPGMALAALVALLVEAR